MSNERSARVNKTINDFLKATKGERLEHLTFGVEIEYQKRGECDCLDDLDAETRYDLERYYEDVRRVKEDHIIEQLRGNEELDERVERWLISFFESKPVDVLREKLYAPYTLEERPTLIVKALLRIKLNAESGTDTEDLLERWGVLENFIEHIIDRILCDDCDTDYVDLDYDYEYDRDTLEEEHCDCRIDEPNGDWESDTDQSVSGGEIRTVGGQSAEYMLSGAADVFGDIENSVRYYTDKNCSAHIHVKLGDISHFYGKGVLHRALMEYILFNLHLLPNEVQARLHEGGNRHIRPQLRDKKFSWVRFHPQGTIEFRLFGNVSCEESLTRCVEFAVDALAYAYRIRKIRKRMSSRRLKEEIDAYSTLSDRGLDAPLTNIAVLTKDDLENIGETFTYEGAA